MRLGSYNCALQKGSLARKSYGQNKISERHRHRYEFNNKFRQIVEKNGLLLSGICEERDLVEVIEIPDHRFFVGVQFHPEFKSKPLDPHPLFTSFIEASLAYKEQVAPKGKSSKKNPSRKSLKVGGRMARA